MSEAWRTVRLGTIARPVKRPLVVIPGSTYRTIGVRWWGEGAYERTPIDGSRTTARTLSRVNEGDLIINKIWVRHGAVAIADLDVDGCAASNEFPTFVLDPEAVEQRWMYWCLKTAEFRERCDALSRGTSGKNRIRPDLFLTIPVPLPPLTEQRRIVARLDAVATRLAEARRQRAEANAELDRLLWTLLRRDSATEEPMSALVKERPPNVIVRPDQDYAFAGVYSFGRGVFSSGVRSGTEISYARLTRLEAGDLVYPKLMAWEGAIGVVSEACSGLAVSTEFPVFEVDRGSVHPRILDIHFRQPEVWEKLSGGSTGTNARRRRLHPREFMRYRMPLPDRRRQAEIVAIAERASQVQSISASSANQTDGLLTSAVGFAFAGLL